MSDGGWSSDASAGTHRSPSGVSLDSIVDIDAHARFTTDTGDRAARSTDRDRDHGSGGYPIDQLFEECAFVAYHFGWSHDDVLALPHWERQRWCEEISAINERMNERRE